MVEMCRAGKWSGFRMLPYKTRHFRLVLEWLKHPQIPNNDILGTCGWFYHLKTGHQKVLYSDEPGIWVSGIQMVTVFVSRA